MPIIRKNTKMCWIEDITDMDQDAQLSQRINDSKHDNISHYRVKNRVDIRENIDLFVYKKLLKMIYNI